MPAWEAENEILGCNHAKPGAYLLARWGLPIEAVESAVFDHEPVNSSGSSLSALASVYVANRILSQKKKPPGSGNECPFISELGKAYQLPEWNRLVSGGFSDESSVSTKELGSDLEQP
ncbi:HDOD domain-containing protein [Candidatus Pelagisphaera phototrophica]|nr:HDOD domain-containing protein [Candidatus Pelagisphaera phototrophica]